MSGLTIGFNTKTVEAFHEQNGLGIKPWGDHLLLLTQKGAKSGREITTPVVYRRDGDAYVVIASKGGAPQHPKWYTNLLANPEAEIEVHEDGAIVKHRVHARPITEGPERDRLYAKAAEVWPSFNDYEKKTDRKIPVVLLEKIAG